jgi:hypothetical protein
MALSTLQKIYPYLMMGTIWILLAELDYIPWTAAWCLNLILLAIPIFFL